MVKIQQLRHNQFSITIPSKLVRAKGWEKGTPLDFTINNKGNLELKEMQRD